MSTKRVISWALSSLLLLGACSGGTSATDQGTPSSPTPDTSATAIADLVREPEAIAFDAEGRLFVSDCAAHRIFTVDATGGISVYAGIQAFGIDGAFSGDGGPAMEAGLGCPAGLAFDPDGDLVFAAHANNRIRMIDPAGEISTIVGSGPAGVDQGGFAGDGGPATEALLSEPIGVAFDRAGDLIFTDRDNHRIRMVDPQGIITTIAGTGEAGSAGDGGPATEAELDQPYYVVVDRRGDVVFADSGSQRVRMIDTDGIITTIAGTGEAGFSGDGDPATEAAMTDPYGLALDDAGNLYVSEGYRVRMIDTHGIITTVAGTGTPGFSGDGGSALKASIQPYGIAIDGRGNLFIADGGNGSIRVVDAQGKIRTFAPS